jgi:FkbM family methyltransferase
MSALRKKIASALPTPVYKLLQDMRKRRRQQLFFKQGFTRARYGAFELEFPENHLLLQFMKHQPYRDLWAGVVAGYVSAKYPASTFVDIGANVGDTAALIATHAKNKLVLVEASDYYFPILSRNARQFPNEVVLKNVMVSAGESISGKLHHWGGTARFEATPGGQAKIVTERLADVAGPQTRFVKVDTDGFDVQILTGGLEWLAAERPAVVFEHDVTRREECQAADQLFEALCGIGYKHFVLWDDPGYHLLSTSSLAQLKDVNRYLFKRSEYTFQKGIVNVDVLCLHERDEDIYNAVTEWYRKN